MSVLNLDSPSIMHILQAQDVCVVPAPFSTNALARSRISEGGSSQNEMLFSRGNHKAYSAHWHHCMDYVLLAALERCNKNV